MGLAQVDRTDLMSNKKAAIAEIGKMRDQLVVMRERLFQLTAATAARTKKVEGLLMALSHLASKGSHAALRQFVNPLDSLNPLCAQKQVVGSKNA